MAENEGGILGPAVKLLGTEPPETSYNIVITGDGFANTQMDQDKFNLITDSFVVEIQKENWFAVLGSAINVYRLNIFSNDSGVVSPSDGCTDKQTYFDTNYCDENNNFTYPDVNTQAIQNLHGKPELPFTVHCIGVVLNSGPNVGLGWGGGGIFVLGEHDWPAVALHELGHAAFGLGDEYEDTNGPFTGGEPAEPNNTIETTRQALKWKSFVAPHVPIITLDNTNCPQPSGGLPNPLPDDNQIGLYEGSRYHTCDVYRPAFLCKMRQNVGDFCRVCIDAARLTLAEFDSPIAHAEVLIAGGGTHLEFGDVPFGETMFRSFEVRNTRIGYPAPVDVALSSGYTPGSGSANGFILQGQTKLTPPFTAEVAGPIQATLTWDPASKGLTLQGSIGPAPLAGQLSLDTVLTIDAPGPLSLSLSWSSQDSTPAALINLDLELYDPSNTLVASSATSQSSEQISYTVPLNALGQYTIRIINNTPKGADWGISGIQPFYPALTGNLKPTGGSAIATFGSATSPATLAYVVPAGEIGDYVFELQVQDSSANYQLTFSYPKANPVMPAPFFFPPETETAFTLPAPVIDDFFAKQVFIGMTALNSPGEFTAAIDVFTSDETNPYVHVTMHGTAVPPAPIDAVLVMDRSGSMSEPTGVPNVDKREMAIEAGKLFVSLLRDDDRIGIVRFNQNADILLNMTLANAAGKATAEGDLTSSNLDPQGMTSIGGGIILGSNVLDQPPLLERRAIVTLTDGIQNTAPDIPDAQTVVDSQNPTPRLFAVGFGLNQLEDKLQKIASATNGWAAITGDLTGWKEFILQKLYVQILADVSNEAFVKDPRESVAMGESRATEVFLSELDASADFVVAFRPGIQGKERTRVSLEAPDGTLIDVSNAGAFPYLQIIESGAHMCFRVSGLGFAGVPREGVWRVWVEHTSRGSTSERDAISYSVMCKARSPLRLDGWFEPVAATPGDPLQMVFAPTLGGRPYSIIGRPIAFMQPPEGPAERVELRQSEDGLYKGQVKSSRRAGHYIGWTEAYFRTPDGWSTTRYRQIGAVVVGGKEQQART